MKRSSPPIEVVRRRFMASGQHPDLKDSVALDSCPDVDGTDDADPPPWLKTHFRQRQAARDVAYQPTPKAGQIVRIHPSDAGEGASLECLAVLLDAEIAQGRWRGWLVGRDTDYASDWDLILGPEDDPRDPLCQMIHIWMSVSLAIERADQVLAELSEDRLAAVRSMAHDYVQGKVRLAVDDDRMGVHLARELMDGTGVVSGTPIREANDPRREYQTLYSETAMLLSQSTDTAHAAPVPQAHSGGVRVLAWFGALHQKARGWFVPVAYALSLLIVPSVVILTMKHQSKSSGSGNYISGAAFQEVRTDQPENLSRQLEKAVRDAGAIPEISHSGTMIMIEVDLKPLTVDSREKLFTAYHLLPVGDGRLRVMIVPIAESTAPR